jgi:hypothetical protein
MTAAPVYIRQTDYRGFGIQTRTAGRKGAWVCEFLFMDSGAPLQKGFIHTIDGTYATYEAAHTAALLVAKKLVDQLWANCESSSVKVP